LQGQGEPIDRAEKETPYNDAQQQEQQPATGFFHHHKKKLIALATVIILAVVIIPSAVIGTQKHSSTSQTDNTNDSNSSPSDNAFDDSKQVNADTPPLNQHFRYGEDPIRGVNLGGWLVLEPFISPSIFEQFPPSEGVVDEWTLCEKLGPDEAKKQIQDHYETFVTEDDFKKIAQMGINHVRIPTGHWAVNPIPSEPFVPNIAWDYLLKGVQWARKYGIRVMVELHTAPGSQNGWNHSGRLGPIGWLNGTQQGEINANLTIDTVLPMVEFFSKPEWSNVVTIFGVLNEPAIYKLDRNMSKQWYLESYSAIRNITGEGKGPILTYHEGFIGLSKWKGFMPNTTFDRTVLGMFRRS
jgi:glucan 1,3-beta-glucosidase